MDNTIYINEGLVDFLKKKLGIEGAKEVDFWDCFPPNDALYVVTGFPGLIDKNILSKLHKDKAYGKKVMSDIIGPVARKKDKIYFQGNERDVVERFEKWAYSILTPLGKEVAKKFNAETAINIWGHNNHKMRLASGHTPEQYQKEVKNAKKIDWAEIIFTGGLYRTGSRDPYASVNASAAGNGTGLALLFNKDDAEMPLIRITTYNLSPMVESLLDDDVDVPVLDEIAKKVGAEFLPGLEQISHWLTQWPGIWTKNSDYNSMKNFSIDSSWQPIPALWNRDWRMSGPGGVLGTYNGDTIATRKFVSTPDEVETRLKEALLGSKALNNVGKYIVDKGTLHLQGLQYDDPFCKKLRKGAKHEVKVVLELNDWVLFYAFGDTKK